MADKSRPTSSLAVAGFVASFIIPPIGVILCIIALVKLRGTMFRGKGLAISGLIIGMLPILFLVWLLHGLGFWHSNQAEINFRPIASQVEAIGGVKLCDNGDSGYGIDNTVPWYHVYYSTPDSLGLTDKIKAIAASQGYELKTDTEYVNELKGLPNSDGTYIAHADKFSEKSDYLLSKDGNSSLKVVINRQADVELYCSSIEKYGNTQSTGNGTIIDFSLSLPDRINN